MIWESHDWKDELAYELRAVKRRMRRAVAHRGEDLEERALVAVEKFVFVCAFIVRKLSEANKLSDELEATLLPVRVFDRINSGRRIDFMNWHHIERFYNLGSPRAEQISPRKLCSILIHSFVFSPVVDDDGSQVQAILFNSDKTKDKKLFCMDFDDLTKFIQSVIKDDVVSFLHDRRTGALVKSRHL